MTRTFASFAFGCRVNAAEKEEIDRKLTSSGFIYDEKYPAFYIINSCAVTQKAEREVRQFIYQIRRRYLKIKVVVTGCVATKWLLDKEKIKDVDLFINNKNKDSLSNLLLKNFSINDSLLETGTAVFDKFLSSGRYLLKIQDGCQRFCSFCIVPFLRGKPKSKTIREIVEEVKSIENKFKEVMLTVVNTEAFGIDAGKFFTDLLSEMMEKTSIPRLSLGSVNPWSIDKKFINFYKNYKDNKRFIKYLHIPIQSGSNKILKLMKRGYTIEEIGKKLKILEKIYPLTFFGTDIILGFPGEEEKDFEETYKFLEDSPISKFHIFRFSKREKTAAYFLSKKFQEPSPQVKIKRAKVLLKLGKKKYQKFLNKHIRGVFPALFLERRFEDYQGVLLDNQILAFVKTGKNFMGEIKDVRIDELKRERLFGKIV